MKSVTLNDGTRVTLRPIQPEDEAGLTVLYSSLSPESVYQPWAHILANVDYERRMAIVAVSPDGKLIAVARYDYDEAAQETEIAIVVHDHWQGKGLGSAMIAELFSYATTKGIHRFRAYVFSENRMMLDMLARLGSILERRTDAGVTSLLLVPRVRAEPEST